MQQAQSGKAEIFRQQHHDKKLLILPNIWDAMSAKMLEAVGFPSVATASVATALTNGYADGEYIPFEILLKIVNGISKAVDLPLTVDMERGFANDLYQLKENVRQLLDNGAVGLNIEDSHPGENGLYTIDEQCGKIAAIRATGSQCGIPVVINARTDVFLQKKEDHTIQHAITRARAYKDAGADCVYPILINNYEDIALFVAETKMPVNVLLLKSIHDLQHLENIGVARVSIGPGLLYHALTKMKAIAEELQNYDTTEFFSQGLVSNEWLKKLLTNIQ